MSQFSGSIITFSSLFTGNQGLRKILEEISLHLICCSAKPELLFSPRNNWCLIAPWFPDPPQYCERMPLRHQSHLCLPPRFSFRGLKSAQGPSLSVPKFSRTRKRARLEWEKEKPLEPRLPASQHLAEHSLPFQGGQPLPSALVSGASLSW